MTFSHFPKYRGCYHLDFRKWDGLKGEVNAALKQLHNDGTINKLKDKWWRDDPRCDQESSKI